MLEKLIELCLNLSVCDALSWESKGKGVKNFLLKKDLSESRLHEIHYMYVGMNHTIHAQDSSPTLAYL